MNDAVNLPLDPETAQPHETFSRQDYQVWLDAILGVARHYRLECSAENVRIASMRAEIDAEAAIRGWPAIHARLAKLDPATAARLHPTDSQRLQRALEICLSSGRAMSELLAESESTRPPYDFLSVGLLPSDRSVLHARIARRFDEMLLAGLDDEVRALRSKYALHLGLPSMRCVGYRQVWEAQDGLIPRREMRDRGVFATRQLAKRQITWLGNGFPADHTYDCLDGALVDKVAARTGAFLRI